MTSILDNIVKTKQREVALLKANSQVTKARPKELPQLSFLKALQSNTLKVIAEVKKASPSRGIIRDDFSPTKLADTFINHGAAALSILTDETYFQGHNDYLISIKQQSPIPILRKEFIIDEIQIKEAFMIGADAILLILAILTEQKAQDLHNYATSLGLDVLVEIHDDSDIKKLKALKDITIIGINNRNLKTFEVNTTTSLTLKKKLLKNYPNAVFVAESGYSTHEELDELKRHNFNAVLIGEGLATNPDLQDYFKI